MVSFLFVYRNADDFSFSPSFCPATSFGFSSFSSSLPHLPLFIPLSQSSLYNEEDSDNVKCIILIPNTKR